MARFPRGQGQLYPEPKTIQVTILLTPTAAKLLNDRVALYRDDQGRPLSRSEYFERWARDLL